MQSAKSSLQIYLYVRDKPLGLSMLKLEKLLMRIKELWDLTMSRTTTHVVESWADLKPHADLQYAIISQLDIGYMLH